MEQDDKRDMVFDLPDWVTTEFRSALESQPTNYIRMHNARLPRTDRHEKPSALTESHIVCDESTSVVEFTNGPVENSRSQIRRHLTSSTGVSNVLMVRVTTKDASLSLSANTIADRVFGPSATMKSTFEDCSFGKLKIQKASGNGINNGVAELSVDASIQGNKIFSLENLMEKQLRDKVGDLSAFDRIAYCVPRGSYFSEPNTDNWLAYAYVGGRRSVFNDQNCGQLSKLVHEIGHNMGLGHSGEGDSAYGDQSGIMGFGYNKANYPVQCFNSAKNWQLGWYSDKSESVNVGNTPWTGSVFGYVDYATATGPVLIRIGDLYLQYNKISHINRDTVERRNQVTITRGENRASTVLAAIDMSHSSYSIVNFKDNRDLVIEVCDYAQVPNGRNYYDLSIRFKDQASRCGQPDQPPTASPALFTALGPVPTRAPTSSPTIPPSHPPTLQPTRAPVPAPTDPPTPFPTPLPTPSPTRLPTRSPTDPPTPMPTQSPVASTIDPSSTPSKSPTAYPTPLASTVPTRSNIPSGLPTSELTCDDHPRAKFPTNEQHGYQGCVWLAARPTYQEQYCKPSHPAYKICEETCGACTDDCEDTEGTFSHHGINRPCLWLSLRLNVQDVVCVPGHEAMEVCPETCGACDK